MDQNGRDYRNSDQYSSNNQEAVPVRIYDHSNKNKETYDDDRPTRRMHREKNMLNEHPHLKGNRVKGLPDPYDDEPKVTHSYTAGKKGPVLREDTVLHEELETFVHSKITERAVHVKGFGAFGHFTTYNSMREYTKLPFLQRPGHQVPVTVRFSLAVSTKGTPDTSRNVRGFSTKFYTDDGIFDLLCNHIPVFLVRDAMRFPESIKAFLPSPVNNLIDPKRFWDFVARAPEATHFVTWLYSDTGTIKSLRKMRAYGVNTYIWRNARDEIFYIKYHWIPAAGEETISKQESILLAGENPDIAGQDLYDTINKGTPVIYELCVQIMDPRDAGKLPFDPLDDTKTWNERQFPLIPVGKLVLNRNPEDYFNQIEKVAFSPANLLEGAEFTNDKMLQGRSTIYWDAQRYRLGPDFRNIPVNMQSDFKPGELVTSGVGQEMMGTAARTEYLKEDNFMQAGERYNGMSENQKARLIENIAPELVVAPRVVQSTVLGYFNEASPEFAKRVLRLMEHKNHQSVPHQNPHINF